MVLDIPDLKTFQKIQDIKSEHFVQIKCVFLIDNNNKKSFRVIARKHV